MSTPWWPSVPRTAGSPRSFCLGWMPRRCPSSWPKPLPSPPDDYCLMLLDGAGWHRSTALRVPSRLRVLSLPPYSPELNRVEHLWEHLRQHYFGNRVFPSLEAVVEQLCTGRHDLDQHPEVVKSTTNFGWITTLCMTSNQYEESDRYWRKKRKIVRSNAGTGGWGITPGMAPCTKWLIETASTGTPTFFSRCAK